jgi:LAO/AO transport system kinase
VRESTTDELLTAFEQGDRRACGRVLSRVEDDAPQASELLHRLYPRTGRARRIGITGPPGAGKSTLVAALAGACRHEQLTLGIACVDPTSPFSGGAILGDRIRMSDMFTDPGVFIRSMGSRGSQGGLARRTREVCDVLDAFGCQVLLIETIGVGQVELDIAEAAETTIVVLVPESGDAIQTMKAGLMEVADVFAVNKSDREGADRMALAVETVLEMRPQDDGWQPPVIRTIATTGVGIPELLAATRQHRAFLETGTGLRERRRSAARQQVRELVDARLADRLWSSPAVAAALPALVEQVAARAATPYQAADRLWRTWTEQRGK